MRWECPACKLHAPRSNARHTLDEKCQWTIKRERLGRGRIGRHPRPGRIQARAEPTADLPGPDLGNADEEEAGVEPEGYEADPEPPDERTGRGPDRTPRHRRVLADAATGE